MRIAIFSDIHTNPVALAAAVVDAQIRQVDQIWSLGDLLGYGADPRECIRLARLHFHRSIPGNHEEMLRLIVNYIRDSGLQLDGKPLPEIWSTICRLWSDPKTRYDAIEILNRLARFIEDQNRSIFFWVKNRYVVLEALLLNCLLFLAEDLLCPFDQLPPEKDDWRWIWQQACAAVDHTPTPFFLDGLSIRLSHGAPPDGGYIYPWSGEGWQPGNGILMSWQSLARYLDNDPDPGCPRLLIMGHSHVPLYCSIPPGQNPLHADTSCMDYGRPFSIRQGITLINPGSLGHPRDLDTRPAYAVLETGAAPSITYYRIKMDAVTEKYREMRSHYMDTELKKDFRGSLADINECDADYQRVIALLEQRKQMECLV